MIQQLLKNYEKLLRVRHNLITTVDNLTKLQQHKLEDISQLDFFTCIHWRNRGRFHNVFGNVSNSKPDHLIPHPVGVKY